MKINQDYLKGLLEAFESSGSPITDINELKNLGFDHDVDNFIFHFEILVDQEIISGASRTGGIGYDRGVSGQIYWSVVPLRLTAKGHEFLEAIRNKEVWNIIKSEFKDASVGTLIRVSKELLDGYMKNKVTKLISNSE
ncbi:MAG: hypothetical protein ACI909_004194 [Planctomycetota bacterium]